MRAWQFSRPLASLLAAVTAVPTHGAARPADQREIIVEGVRNREKTIDQFVRDLTPAPVGGQLARFEQAICPSVQGLRDSQNSKVAQRIRDVVKAAGIATSKAHCDPNLIVLVTPNKRALLESLAKHRSDYFPAEWGRSQVLALERDPSPVAAWQFEAITRADGTLVPEESASGAFAGDSPRAYYLNRTTEGASRLKPLGRRSFVGAIVVVQGNSLVGLTTTQLADYVTMRALIRTDPDNLRTSAPTILSVIEAPMGTPIPITLTSWDLSFLKAFYGSSKTSYANYQRSEIQRLMAKDLAPAPSKD
jgi:hypothetical protein